MKKSQYTNSLLFIILMFLGCSMSFAADIYAPSIPSIALDLGTSINNAQYSMSIYMLGVSLSLLFYGSMSEVYGRRLPMIFGLLVMLAGSIFCFYAQNIEMLIWGRLIQGVGAAGPAALWRAIFRDTYSGDDLAKYSSYAVLVVILIIPVAPIIGGFFDEYIDWRANFVFLMGYIAIGILGIFYFVPETNKSISRSNLKFSYVIRQYVQTLTDFQFLGPALAVFFVYGAFFSIMVISPVLFVDVLGVSPSHFGLLIGIGGGVVVAFAGIINGRLVKKHGARKMLLFGLSLAIVASIFIIILFFINGVGIYSIIIPILIMDFGIMFVFPNAFALAMENFSKNAGYAGALYSFLQILGGGILGVSLSNFADENQLILGIITTLCLIFSLSCFKLCEYAKTSLSKSAKE